MTIKEGDTLPEATFMHMSDGAPAPATTADIFGGKTVALFSVPGAYTPTCSAQHLPSYVNNHDALKAKGIDTVACMAVNDVFVMDAWGKDQNANGKVLMLADGNGEFTQAIGLELDASKFGLGMRGQRFSMVVENQVVKHLFVEDAGQYDVSSAEHMLAQLG